MDRCAQLPRASPPRNYCRTPKPRGGAVAQVFACTIFTRIHALRRASAHIWRSRAGAWVLGH